MQKLTEIVYTVIQIWRFPKNHMATLSQPYLRLRVDRYRARFSADRGAGNFWPEVPRNSVRIRRQQRRHNFR